MATFSGPPYIYATRSARWRYDGLWSYDSGGVSLLRRTTAIGDNLRIPPTLKGPARTVEFIIIAPDGGLGTDSAWDTQAQLTITPRVIHVPDPF